MAKWRSRAAWLLAGSILTSGFAGQASAQGAASDNSNDIVVTARRVEERLQDVPISITVYNQEQISNRNIVTASELGTYTPSLSTNSRFGTDKASFAIRGFVQELSTAPSVGVYFADVVAPRSAGATTGGSGSGPGMFFDLQNVQVLKGPQGTLFGRNTTGGAILLVPQKPKADLGGYIEGTIGDYDLTRVQAVLNVPLSDTFRVRLGIDRNKRDGYLRNRSTIGPRRFGDTNYTAARLSIVGDLTPNLENYTIFSYSHSDTNGSLMRPLGCDRARAVLNQLTREGCAQIDRMNARPNNFWDVENAAPDPYTRLTTWQVINTTTWQASDTLTIKNIVSYSEYKEAYSFDLNGLNLQPVAGRPFSYILAGNPPGVPIAEQSGFTEELQFQGRTANGSFIWQAGAFLELSDPLGRSAAQNALFASCTGSYHNFQCRDGLVPPVPPLTNAQVGYTPAFVTSTSWQIGGRSIGIYGQGTYNLTEQLALTAGVRYTWDRTRANSQNLRILFPQPNTPLLTCGNNIVYPNPANPAGGKIVTDRRECHINYATSSKKPTWMIDLEYKPINDLMLYAKWARGYRQGYINPNAIAFETWKPEKVDTYEIGAKTSFRGGAVSGYFNVAAFYNDFTAQQLFITAVAKPGIPIAGVNATLNAGRSVIKGVEVDASVTAFDSLKFDVGYAYLDTKLKSITLPSLPANSPYGSFVQPTIGDMLSLTPKHRVTLTGSYTLPLDESIGKITFGATYIYTGEQLSGARFLPSGAVNPFAVLPSTNLVNLNANWNDVLGQPIDLSVFVTNVTNEEVNLNIGNSYVSTGIETMLVGPPRMFGVRVKYRFNE